MEKPFSRFISAVAGGAAAQGDDAVLHGEGFVGA